MRLDRHLDARTPVHVAQPAQPRDGLGGEVAARVVAARLEPVRAARLACQLLEEARAEVRAQRHHARAEEERDAPLAHRVHVGERAADPRLLGGDPCKVGPAEGAADEHERRAEEREGAVAHEVAQPEPRAGDRRGDVHGQSDRRDDEGEEADGARLRRGVGGGEAAAEEAADPGAEAERDRDEQRVRPPQEGRVVAVGVGHARGAVVRLWPRRPRQ